MEGKEMRDQEVGGKSGRGASEENTWAPFHVVG